MGGSGSVLPLQHFARALPGRGTTVFVVPAVCPCHHKMGTSSRGALSGPGRGQGEAGLPARASSQPHIPRALGTLVPARRGVQDPSPSALLRAPAPSPPALAQVSLTGHPLVAVGVSAPGHSQPRGTLTLTTAWHSLSWHPCPAASGPTSHTAAKLWSTAGQIFTWSWPRLVLQLALLQLQC